ncbi:hypothetical protein HDU92_002689 [Lobulomyces angularis]|nr:hypothetical protein HDU92_002689 [Lobulomyces angularis]
MEVTITFVSAADLFIADGFLGMGKNDTFIKANINNKLFYNTRTIKNNNFPTWNEEWRIAGVAENSVVTFDIFDKDHNSPDTFLASASLVLTKEDVFKKQMELPCYLKNGKRKGILIVEITKTGCLSTRSLSMHTIGEIKFRKHSSKVAGFFTSDNITQEQVWYNYKLWFHDVDTFFEGKRAHWNLKYPAAQRIFGSRPGSLAVRTMLHSQHQSLYSTTLGLVQDGVLSELSLNFAEAFLILLTNGERNGKPSVYTYAIVEDGTWRFSETGAAFLADMISKHAMHASLKEEVVYAGEFVLIPSTLKNYVNAPLENTKSRYTLVIVSGTYAPPKENLHMLKSFMEYNFNDIQRDFLTVEALDREDLRWKEYRRLIK